MPINHEQIRVLSLALITYQGKFLACAGSDKVTNKKHLRLLGGGVDFGEKSIFALRREIKEELGLEIKKPKLLGIEENVFKFNGLPGHEIVYLYEVNFRSEKAYREQGYDILDSNQGHRAEWFSKKDLNNRKLYPELALKYL